MDPIQQAKNSRSKTYNAFYRNREWNVFREEHPKYEPIQICRQVLRHKRFLHSQLGQRQRLLHDNRTLHQLANSTTTDSIKNRTKLRSHLLNPDYWHVKKIVDDKEMEIRDALDMIKEYKVEAKEVEDLHEQIASLWAQINASNPFQEEQYFGEPDQEEKTKQQADPLQLRKQELLERVAKEKQRSKELQRKIRQSTNRQGQLLQRKQRLQQIRPIRW